MTPEEDMLATRPAAPSLLAALLAAVALGGCGSEFRSDLWSVPDRYGCTTVNIGWSVDEAHLTPLMGDTLEPASGEPPTEAPVVLYGISCPETTVNGDGTGPVAVAMLLVMLRDDGVLPDTVVAGEPDGPMAVVMVWGGSDDPARRLFGRHGMPTREASVELEAWEGNNGYAASMSVRSDSGRIRLSVTGAGEAETREEVAGLYSTGVGRWAAAVGRTSAANHFGGEATVRSEGTTLLDDVPLPTTFSTVAVGRTARWSWTFRSRPRD